MICVIIEGMYNVLVMVLLVLDVLWPYIMTVKSTWNTTFFLQWA